MARLYHSTQQLYRCSYWSQRANSHTYRFSDFQARKASHLISWVEYSTGPSHEIKWTVICKSSGVADTKSAAKEEAARQALASQVRNHSLMQQLRVIVESLESSGTPLTSFALNLAYPNIVADSSNTCVPRLGEVIEFRRAPSAIRRYRPGEVGLDDIERAGSKLFAMGRKWRSEASLEAMRRRMERYLSMFAFGMKASGLKYSAEHVLCNLLMQSKKNISSALIFVRKYQRNNSGLPRESEGRIEGDLIVGARVFWSTVANGGRTG
ncbi:hypothetical protein C8R43DRAFT_960738 [Mycena crocata]|nr:hypothetical protein C8R43DRAFT_960738 [Mycena crocata]